MYKTWKNEPPNLGFEQMVSQGVRGQSSYLGTCRQVSNIRRTWVGNEIVDHSDVVEAAPVALSAQAESRNI